MISGEVMPVIGKWLNYMSRLHDGVDAILIADRHGTIEYSAMFSEQENGLADEGFIGKNILEAYPQLTEETSSHFRVMRTGAPVLNEKQELTDFYGRRTILVSSTFPLEYSGELIGTMETSVFYHKDAQLDGKNHWLANPHKGLFRLDDIITQNPEMLTLKDTVQRVAANTSPVLIWGETGTGKELFAQSLHSHSSRARGPFVAQNCAAIPTTLLESTLFGTTRGSYTGAENRKGLLKQADGGTLFLDEVNSMDLSLQAKILKAIEEKRFCPVGGEQDVHSDVRIVSAMNVDPITAVREGLLRRDLFYRLGVVQLALPPLRKRPEDIPLLTDFYVEQYNRNMGRAISGVSELVRNALLAYDWPGNVRELRNVIERAVLISPPDRRELPLEQMFSPDPFLSHTTKQTSLSSGIPMPSLELSLQDALEQFEQQYIQAVIDKNKGQLSEAARSLGIHRTTLYRKQQKKKIPTSL